MQETTKEGPKARVKAVKAQAVTAGESDADGAHDSYVVPLVGMRVPGVVVNVGFWGGWPEPRCSGPLTRRSRCCSVPAC